MLDNENLDFREPVALTPEAAEKIKKFMGFLPTEDSLINVMPAGPRIMVKLYTGEENEGGDKHMIKKDGTKSLLLMGKAEEQTEVFTTCVGMVVAMNRSCYQSERFRLSGPFCKLGDWAIVPRNEGTLLYIKGNPVHIIYDDRVVGTTNDPKIIRR
jgi:hypothetical protein